MKNRTIELGITTYAYTLRQSLRARRLRVSVSAGGVLAVSAPSWVSGRFIERFLREHAEWIGEQVQRFSQRVPNPFSQGGKREYAQHKETARTLAMARLVHFNQAYGYDYYQISIRNQKTRWGSCSKQGNLSFNYRIALLPPALADYVILHELCHLGAFDHSARFWSLVARTMPDFRERRRALRQLGAQQLS
ncbi:MAG: M48 family metallopeptidase [Candidatus Moraniibacteriota bacterium]|nr:MAG: M48 family metallopeptidase [Candidatus Moranbacteria bacterium]